MSNIFNSRNRLASVTNTNATTGKRSFKQGVKQYSVKAWSQTKATADGTGNRVTIALLREGLCKSAKLFLENNDDRIYLPCDRHSKDWREHKEVA